VIRKYEVFISKRKYDKSSNLLDPKDLEWTTT